MRAFHSIPIWNQRWFTWKRRFRLRIESHGDVINCTHHVNRINIHCFACWKLVLILVHLKASRDYLLLTQAGMYMLLLAPRFHLYPTAVPDTTTIQRLICRACCMQWNHLIAYNPMSWFARFWKMSVCTWAIAVISLNGQIAVIRIVNWKSKNSMENGKAVESG